MPTSAMTTKGQVTIPVHMRKRLGWDTGDKIGFSIEDDHIKLFRMETNIEAAFGICHPSTSATLEDIEDAIHNRGGHAGS